MSQDRTEIEVSASHNSCLFGYDIIYVIMHFVDFQSDGAKNVAKNI
ncbi:MAG: hypothetical protein CM15mP55_1850 [Hyphomicrobiales bacterium]|nr:MAG: hypothetical protein CM15mP55_1850 [Hyphomicrobiales bacterium]